MRDGTLNSSYYFLDMEFCDLNLESYITRTWSEEMWLKVPYFTIEQPTRMRTAQIWDIMEDITRGVAYIHNLNEVHRDLKPCNGISVC
jgi:serine/threonine protein kinase